MDQDFFQKFYCLILLIKQELRPCFKGWLNLRHIFGIGIHIKYHFRSTGMDPDFIIQITVGIMLRVYHQGKNTL